MDKNTIWGFILIAAILIGFSIMNRPSEEEERQRVYRDSVALVRETMLEAERTARNLTELNSEAIVDNANDSIQTAKIRTAHGAFANTVEGEEREYVLENELVKITLSNKGGKIIEAELKNFLSRDSLPVKLFTKENANYSFTFATRNNHIINTSALYFETVDSIVVDQDGNQHISFRLRSDSDAWMDFVYTLPADDYMVGFSIKSTEMNRVMPLGSNYMILNWEAKIRQQERGRQFEERYTSLNYKFVADDMEKLSESKDDARKIANRLQWIAFKNQYFSTVLIAEKDFSNSSLESRILGKDTDYLKAMKVETTIDYNPTTAEDINFRFYFGPNKYKTLASYDRGVDADQRLQLRKLIPLGWGIFGWVNRFAIIPMFNLFSSFIESFGIIILLMTIVIKTVLFPLTYKSYVSSAKMRVLKPEIDEINSRIPADKPAERQKATMDLYKKVGVSPFSGCLPTLLQMPILFAMFSFFPSSIELRGESFLWAKDLSSYDAIVSWDTYIPIISPYFGNHISLFTLLMTITTLISTKLNMSNTATPDQPGAGMMKWMMYLMPLMFLVMFNSYASGLSYYYFVSTLITIGQTYAIRATIDEKKLLAQLHAKRVTNSNKKLPPAKKSGFLDRLEKMQKEQEKMMRERAKKKK